MVAIVLAFFGLAFGRVGLEMMLKGGEITTLIGIVLCFLSIVMVLKALTRLALWLASSRCRGLS